jgi:hypothetical protein
MIAPADPEKTQQLRRLAFRLRSNSDFMASALAVYKEQEKLDDFHLARRLRMEEDRLPFLALCKRPNSESEHFAAQVRQVSQYTGADPTVLAQLVRQVEAVAGLSSLPANTASAASSAHSASPFLAAARDRDQVAEPQDEYGTADVQDSDETNGCAGSEEEGE